MKTDDFITALAADLPTRPISTPRALALALMVSTPIACGLLIYVLKVRPDIASAAQSVRFLFKLAFTLSMAGAGAWLAARLSRPGASARPAVLGLAAALALLGAAVLSELAVLPFSAWMTQLVGTMALQCVVLIPAMSAIPLAVILWALRSGAPDKPGSAGAAAGLLAAGVGATFYAAHCPNDSPLYLAVWYLIGISAVALAGSLIGSRVLKW